MAYETVSAVILAAGESRRMGQPKLLMPWGKTNVLGQVVATISTAGVSDILIVTGGGYEQIEDMLAGLAKTYPVRTTYNPDVNRDGMLSSVKAGLAALGTKPQAALIALGDQPQVHEETVRNICTAYLKTKAALVIPSFENQRGHPWLAGRPLWEEILALPRSATARHFLNDHAGQVAYIPADNSILQDLDTPEDYSRLRP